MYEEGKEIENKSKKKKGRQGGRKLFNMVMESLNMINRTSFQFSGSTEKNIFSDAQVHFCRKPLEHIFGLKNLYYVSKIMFLIYKNLNLRIFF